MASRRPVDPPEVMRTKGPSGVRSPGCGASAGKAAPPCCLFVFWGFGDWIGDGGGVALEIGRGWWAANYHA